MPNIFVILTSKILLEVFQIVPKFFARQKKNEFCAGTNFFHKFFSFLQNLSGCVHNKNSGYAKSGFFKVLLDKLFQNLS